MRWLLYLNLDPKKKRLWLLDRLIQQVDDKGIDAYKYCGVLDIVEDPLDIQSNLRDEWE